MEKRYCNQCNREVFPFTKAVQELTGEWGVCNNCWESILAEVIDEWPIATNPQEKEISQ